MEHKQECLDQQEKWKKEVAEFEKRFPNYCRTCGGYGGAWGSYDPSPSGVSLSPGSMAEFSECPDCTEKGICSLCGAKVECKDGVFDFEKPCPGCKYIHNGTIGIPQQPECPCWYDEWLRDQEEAEEYFFQKRDAVTLDEEEMKVWDEVMDPNSPVGKRNSRRRRIPHRKS